MTETLHSEIEIAAPQATVFAFLTDPDKILRWMGTKATVEPYPGGIYLLSMNDTHTARGQFTEVIPVHRLAYSFGWEGNENVPPGSGLIEIDLVEKDGGTLVRFTHGGLPDEKERANHEKGWNHYLRRLAVAAAGGDPGPDTSLEARESPETIAIVQRRRPARQATAHNRALQELARTQLSCEIGL